MRSYVEIMVILPLLIGCYQLYTFSVNSEGRKLQERSRKLGIVFMSAGIASLAYKSVPFAFFGIVLMMFGFRLIAKGLERLEKKVFIDRFEDNK